METLLIHNKSRTALFAFLWLQCVGFIRTSARSSFTLMLKETAKRFFLRNCGLINAQYLPYISRPVQLLTVYIETGLLRPPRARKSP